MSDVWGGMEILCTALESFGGHLECMTCHRIELLGNVTERTFGVLGWPKCCGYTMRWITARQEREAGHEAK